MDAMDFKGIDPLWRLCDPLTVHQAAALIAGWDPSVVRFHSNQAAWVQGEPDLTDSNGTSRAQIAFSALVNAIMAGKIKAKIVHDSRPLTDADSDTLRELAEIGEYRNNGYDDLCEDDETFTNGRFVANDPNWEKSLVDVEEIRAWLQIKGMRTGFFFPNAVDAPDYLDPKNLRYAPKLAAGVRAWQAVTDPGGKHPRQALMKWLREHAAEFGMTDEDGAPVNQAVEDVSKVANWKPGGGAPRTPGE